MIFATIKLLAIVIAWVAFLGYIHGTGKVMDEINEQRKKDNEDEITFNEIQQRLSAKNSFK